MKRTYLSILSAVLLSTVTCSLFAQSPSIAKGKDKAAATDNAASKAPAKASATETKTTKTETKAAEAPAKKDISLKISNLSSPVKAGSDATVSVQTEPNAMCNITVKYKSGPATAAGLKAQRADKDGKATWNWKVAKNCAPGEWPVEITASLKRAKASANGTLKVEK